MMNNPEPLARFEQSDPPAVSVPPVQVETITELLHSLDRGGEDAAEQLARLVYDELHVLAVAAMRGEADGHTWQPTELVHEAFARLVSQSRTTWRNRHQFFGVAAQAMRRLLVDHARARRQRKRDGGTRVPLNEETIVMDNSAVDVLALNDALERLARLDTRQVHIVELRYFGGFSIDEISEMLHISPATVKRDWTVARAFLRNALSEAPED